MFVPLGVEWPQGAEPKNKAICQRQMALFFHGVSVWMPGGLGPKPKMSAYYCGIVKDKD